MLEAVTVIWLVPIGVLAIGVIVMSTVPFPPPGDGPKATLAPDGKPDETAKVSGLVPALETLREYRAGTPFAADWTPAGMTMDGGLRLKFAVTLLLALIVTYPGEPPVNEPLNAVNW